MDDSIICPLCLHFQPEITGDFFVVGIPCGHVYHNFCIMNYLIHGKQNCPVCNTPVHPRKLTKLYGIDPNSKLESKATPAHPTIPIMTTKEPTSKDSYTYIFKLALLGSSGVGKSCLLKRFAVMKPFEENTFVPNINATRGVDLVRKNVTMGNVNIQLIIWDTIGQETFHSITSTVVRDVQGIIYVFDITKPGTLKELQYWFDFAENYGPKNCVKILVGNQADLEEKRMVSFQEGKAIADQYNIPFFETSAKNADNVEATFHVLTAKILENEWLMSSVRNRMNDQTTIRVRDSDNKDNSEPSCLTWFRRGWQNFLTIFDGPRGEF